ncbi:hypothetical protein [Polynucleobacter sp. MWH-Aus1W21]|uniref:hypothetical protein n=1 Tax=Polynucleobacter sp. MWH-Aus1W21 TaxID=1855880 RepID=UPI001BFCDE00|nr:hypothetical protein [Polynucleobacter sp. MWH-Aus1W21]QWD66390.1 hypothetical protein ICW03_00790 [Polynucleobacter sp. MWH-Aus1W21]
MSKLFKISSEWFIGCAISAIAYTIIFYFNSWLTNSLVFSLGVNWIYLPAGLRLFLTLIFGLPGALGIAIASFLISYYGDFPHELTLCVGVGLISGFAPYLARFFVFSNLRLESDLSNLNLPKLIACILIYSLLSAGLHQWWFSTMTLEDTGSVNHFVVMFVGDVLGSLLLVTLIKYCLDLLKKVRKTAH